MPENRDKLFQFVPLTDYTLKQRISIRFADMLFYVLIRALGSTVRFEVRGNENLEAIERSGKLPIYAFWHDRIFLGTYYFRRRGIVVMTSKSFDGEYIARFIQRLGYGAIRGSSSRGGARALVEMIRSMRQGHPMAFTVDGPRGPRYQVKPGPIALAKKTGNAVLPFVIEPRRYWKVKSWDRMQIPVPFTRALLIIGEPIYVDGDADDAGFESKVEQLQAELDSLTAQGSKWSENSDQDASAV